MKLTARRYIVHPGGNNNYIVNQSLINANTPVYRSVGPGSGPCEGISFGQVM